MQCEICGRGPDPSKGGVTIHRQNKKGVKGIWRCLEHNTLPVSKEAIQIIEALNPQEMKFIKSNKPI